MKTQRKYSPLLFPYALHSSSCSVAVIYMIIRATHYKVKPSLYPWLYFIRQSIVYSGSRTVKVSASPKEKASTRLKSPFTYLKSPCNNNWKLTHMPEKIVPRRMKTWKSNHQEASEVNDRIAALEAIKRSRLMQRYEGVVNGFGNQRDWGIESTKKRLQAALAVQTLYPYSAVKFINNGIPRENR